MLRAGTATFDITPADLPRLQGHYSPDPAAGVLAPIEGRVLTLGDQNFHRLRSILSAGKS